MFLLSPLFNAMFYEGLMKLEALGSDVYRYIILHISLSLYPPLKKRQFSLEFHFFPQTVCSDSYILLCLLLTSTFP